MRVRRGMAAASDAAQSSAKERTQDDMHQENVVHYIFFYNKQLITCV